tara:strand:- start:1150 stop:1446 length:297 start_codon:yes stop_codon:yes gene_type:complete
MTTVSKELMAQLEQIQENTQLPLEKRLIQTAIWFHKNKGRIPRENLSKRVDFLELMLDITLEINAMLVQRMQRGEGRTDTPLWLPSGMQVSGDVRKFG